MVTLKFHMYTCTKTICYPSDILPGQRVYYMYMFDHKQTGFLYTVTMERPPYTLVLYLLKYPYLKIHFTSSQQI